MAWTIEYSSAAGKQLGKLDQRSARRIVDFMDHRVAVADNPRKLGKALAGPLSSMWRFRVGDFRVLCEFKDDRLVVLVLKIGDRKDVYR